VRNRADRSQDDWSRCATGTIRGEEDRRIRQVAKADWRDPAAEMAGLKGREDDGRRGERREEKGEEIDRQRKVAIIW